MIEKLNLRNALDKMDTDNKITDVLEKIKWPEYFMIYGINDWMFFYFLVCFISVALKDIKS
jgi:hypothetical protein